MAEDEQASRNGRKPDRRHAVDNPVRREILREMLNAPAPMTVAELDELVPTDNVSSLSYHVGVLEREECIAREGEVGLSSGVLPAYVATVGDDPFVIEILKSSRHGDERR